MLQGWSPHGRLSNKVVNNVRYLVGSCQVAGQYSSCRFFCLALTSVNSRTMMLSKVVLANAVQYLMQDVKIWLAAAGLEHDPKAKKRVLPFNAKVNFWLSIFMNVSSSFLSSSRTYSQLGPTMEGNRQSSTTNAWILPSHTVEAIPLSVEHWLALVRLQVPERAKIKSCWREISGWRRQRGKRAKKVREHVEGYVAMGLEDEDQLDTWVRNAESAETKGWPLDSQGVSW